MDANSGMLIGSWTREKDLLEAMRGKHGSRTILSVSVRTAPGTRLLFDGEAAVVPESGLLRGDAPKASLCIDSDARVYARVEYQFEETLF